ncbi:thioester-containing protein 1 allele R1-like isoform X2 [Paramacrobiotus metropolitanus]|uniref:thioester-containing protein 1 allele R1-like isoform X2 n=1 Tax=Paramacrobiotus metropolitanus TaxID=2943436 RepID=UPI0024459EEE|nr:thioester-containing protein 1 allele R1-like isoform X2 [Paramacrobiotus metropolitanus]
MELQFNNNILNLRSLVSSSSESSSVYLPEVTSLLLTLDNYIFQITLVHVGIGNSLIGDVPHDGSYQLIVVATCGGTTRTETSDLMLMVVDNTVLLQTDKPIYRPEDVIHFRVIVLDEQLRLSRNVQTVSVYLKDPVGEINWHKSLSWQNDKFPGFFNGTIEPLPLEPELGEWSIEVLEVDGKKIASKRISVSNYELPKFSISITGPAYIMRDDSIMLFEISLKDHFGHPIRGDVQIFVSEGESVIQESMPQMITASGRITVPIDLNEDGKVNCKGSAAGPHMLNITATARELTTNRKVITTQNFPVFCDRLQLLASIPWQSFQPGFAVNVTIRAVMPDGQPYVLGPSDFDEEPCSGEQLDDTEPESNEDPDDSESPEISSPAYSPLTIDTAFRMDASTLVIPVTTASSAKEMELTCTVGELSRKFKFPRHNGVLATIQMERGQMFRVGDVVRFSVACTQGCTTMEIVVASRQNVLYSRTYNMTNEHSGPLSLQVTADMVPTTSLVAYFVAYGIPGSDMVEFHVQQASLLTNLTVTAVPENLQRAHLRPGLGEKVRINVQASKNTLVAFLAVDKGLRQLDSTFDNITTEIGSHPAPPAIAFGSENDDLAAFSNAGLIVHLFTQDIPDSFSSGRKRKNKPAKKPTGKILRQDFRDSFLFYTGATDDQGKLRLVEQLPDAITTWSITAFAVGLDTPLAITTTPTEVHVVQDAYIDMPVPVTLIENEVVFLKATVYANASDPLRADPWKLVVEIGYPLLSKTFAFDYTGNADNVQFYQFRFGPYKASTQTITASLLQGNELIDRVRKNVTIIRSGTVRIRTSDTYLLRNGSTIHVPIPLPEHSAAVVPDSKQCTVQMYSDAWGSLLQQVASSTNVQDYDHLAKRKLTSRSCDHTVAWLMTFGLLRQHLQRLQHFDTVQVKELLDRLSRNIRNLRVGQQPYGPQRSRSKVDGQQAYGLKRFRNKVDGSYSLKGTQATPGSTWLTASAIRAQLLTRDVVPVNRTLLSKSLAFLDSRLDGATGMFAEKGGTLDISMQGGARTQVSLTAFVLLAYIEAEHHSTTMQIAQAALERHLSGLNSTYEMAITCLVLQKLQSPAYSPCPSKLLAAAETAPGILYWPAPKIRRNRNASHDIDVETTAYSLLALHGADNVTDVGPIANWLMSQRTPNGEFRATQNEVVLLYAMSEMVLDVVHSTKPCQIHVDFDNGESCEMHLRSDEIEPQMEDVPLLSSAVTLSNSGEGTCRAVISCRYNEVVVQLAEQASQLSASPTDGEVEITTKLVADTDANQLTLEICLAFDGNSEEDRVVDAEVPALSCYVFEENSGEAVTVITDWDTQIQSCKDFLMWRQVCTPEISAARTVRVRRSTQPSNDIVVSYSLSDASNS